MFCNSTADFWQILGFRYSSICTRSILHRGYGGLGDCDNYGPMNSQSVQYMCSYFRHHRFIGLFVVDAIRVTKE